jgi:hypothetical protein
LSNQASTLIRYFGTQSRLASHSRATTSKLFADRSSAAVR